MTKINLSLKKMKRNGRTSLLKNIFFFIYIIIFAMLKFNPPHYLSFTPNSQEKLQSSFIISNLSSSCTTPFKIKSNKPDLFIVQPFVGVISPLQQVIVHITSQSKGNLPTNKDIKFLIEYSLLDKHPDNLNQALLKITQQNKQLHVLYTEYQSNQAGQNNPYRQNTNHKINSNHEIRSSTSIRSSNPSFKVLEAQQEDYLKKNDGQKFDYLRQEIDHLEKQKIDLIHSSKGSKRKLNLAAIIIIFIVTLVLGNLLGKFIGLNNNQKQTRQYRYYGLQKIWASQPQVKQKSWYQFWK